MDALKLTNWKLTLELEDGPGQWPKGSLVAPPDQLRAFKAEHPGPIGLSTFSPLLTGSVSFSSQISSSAPNSELVFLAPNSPIMLKGENLRPRQVVEVYSDGRIESHQG
jgi:hypothetical protein